MGLSRSTADAGAAAPSGTAPGADPARVQTTGLDELARRFYERRGNRTAWLESGRPSPAARAMLDAIHHAADEGLDPADYPIEPIERSLAPVPAPNGSTLPAPALAAGQQASFDARMTTVFLRYASDLATGRVDPRAIHPDWHIPPNEFDVAALVAGALEKDRVPDVLRELPPPHPEYARLREALAALRAEASTPGADGSTSRASRRPASSVPAILPAERIRRVTLSMERWRWVPRELGNPSIVINIPAYRLDVLGGGRSLLSMRIVAGKAFTPTPVFSDTITSLVVNPTWNIPEGIARDEILPAALRDPRYLGQKGIHAVSGNGDKAHEIDPASLREPAPGGSLPFVLRQDPGPENPLGRIKFLMPNKYDIYLHDTPAGHLFAKEERAFSHGCIEGDPGGPPGPRHARAHPLYDGVGR
jgi:murein L,D-transpeptidase YcbB/YkuD